MVVVASVFERPAPLEGDLPGDCSVLGLSGVSGLDFGLVLTVWRVQKTSRLAKANAHYWRTTPGNAKPGRIPVVRVDSGFSGLEVAVCALFENSLVFGGGIHPFVLARLLHRLRQQFLQRWMG